MSSNEIGLVIEASSSNKTLLAPIEKGYIDLSLIDHDKNTQGKADHHNCKNIKPATDQQQPLKESLSIRTEASTVSKLSEKKELGHRLRAMRESLDLGLDSSYERRQRWRKNNSLGETISLDSISSTSIQNNSYSRNTSYDAESRSSVDLKESSFIIDSNQHNSTANTLLLNTSSSSSIKSNYYNTDDSVLINSSSHKQQSPESVFEDFYKAFRDDVIRQELKLLSRHHQDGVWVTPSGDSLQVWFGVFVVKQLGGPYQEGVFHFTVFFKDDFPESVPVIRFRNQIFHPMVEPRKGTFDTSRFVAEQSEVGFQKGKRKTQRIHVWQLLRHLRESFCCQVLNTKTEEEKKTSKGIDNIDINSAANETAAIMYKRENKKEFLKESRHCVLRSLNVYNRQNTGRKTDARETLNDNLINNPLESTPLVDDSFLRGFIRFLVANDEPSVRKSRNYAVNTPSSPSTVKGAFGWARGQLGRVLNNLNTSYSLIDGNDKDQQ